MALSTRHRGLICSDAMGSPLPITELCIPKVACRTGGCPFQLTVVFLAIEGADIVYRDTLIAPDTEAVVVGVTATDRFYRLGISDLGPATIGISLPCKFAVNAFAGRFEMTHYGLMLVSDGMGVLLDGPSRHVYSLTSTSSDAFLGYIRQSASPMSQTVIGEGTHEFVNLDAISFANGTNASGPSAGKHCCLDGPTWAGVLGLGAGSRRRFPN